MKCPQCQALDTKVIESRDAGAGESIRRRRECISCGYRFTTYERLERPNIVVIKKGNRHQLFDRTKLMAGVERASEKTSISAPEREALVSRVEQALYDKNEPEISSDCIGELVMEELAGLDEVAYVRFASVYRSFKDLKSFEKELSSFKSRLHDSE